MSIPDLETYLPKVISWRRDLHMHPELGLQEVRTSNLIADLLTKFGLDVQRNFAGTAVLGTLHTNKPGKTVVLRADMDALPIQDAKDVPYRSQISGVCHACGHDAHTANLLGVANYISDHRTEFCGTIKFLFQPAEELLEGAKLVCQSGVLDGTDYILGQHAVLDVDVGQVQVCYGPSNGGGDEFTLRLHGVGCHGARPHTGKDPILLAAKVIEGFQQIISRELDPLKAAVISVCSVQAGQHESKNVVPQEAVLAGTVRTLEEDVRTYVLTRMEEIVAGLCSASRCSYTLEHVTKVPPLTSDQQLRTPQWNWLDVKTSYTALLPQWGLRTFPGIPGIIMRVCSTLAPEMSKKELLRGGIIQSLILMKNVSGLLCQCLFCFQNG